MSAPSPGHGALLVFAGGLVGAAGRALVSAVIPTEAGAWPTSTLLVNLIGAFVLGIYLAVHQRRDPDGRGLHLWVVGVLGTFTTFSALSHEVFSLFEAGRATLATTYAVTSVGAGLLVAFVGARLGGLVE